MSAAGTRRSAKPAAAQRRQSSRSSAVWNRSSKPPSRRKASVGQAKVVRRQETLAARHGPIVARKQVEDELGGLGIDVGGQAIARRSAHRVRRRCSDARGENGEPTRLRSAVVVGEGDDFTAGDFEATIARGRRSGVLDREQPQA
jgi:hypothetical protein